MRLGGPVFGTYSDPGGWIACIRKHGYRAVWPPKAEQTPEALASYAEAARKHDIVIAEVGAWSNPLSADADERKQAVKKCEDCLALADAIGARCCVNIAGSRGKKWDGPDPRNLDDDTFDLIVQGVRGIIDAVKPKRTFYTLETMPWIFPDSADSYLRLIKAIDRKQFAAHYDPVNVVNSPARYFRTGAMIREAFAKLGPYIKALPVGGDGW